MVNEVVELFSMFSGYGGAEFGLAKANIPFKVVGFCEIKKAAIACYLANHGDVKNFGDVRKIRVDDLPNFSLLTAGFPCQSFSMAGKRMGFDDTRGTLFRDIIRIAEAKKPKYMVLENVAGLVSHDDGKTFSIILREIKRIGNPYELGQLPFLAPPSRKEKYSTNQPTHHCR